MVNILFIFPSYLKVNKKAQPELSSWAFLTIQFSYLHPYQSHWRNRQ